MCAEMMSSLVHVDYPQHCACESFQGISDISTHVLKCALGKILQTKRVCQSFPGVIDIPAHV